MLALLETIHALGLLTCFALLGTSRIGACIRWLSLQGILFGLVPLILHQDGFDCARSASWPPRNIALKGHRVSAAAAAAAGTRRFQPRGRAVCRLRRVGPVRDRGFGPVASGSRSELKPALRQAPFAMLEAFDLPDLGRPLPDHQPAQRADAGHRLSGARERHLCLRRDHRRRDAAAGRTGRAARRLRRGVRDGDRDLSTSTANSARSTSTGSAR